MATPKPRHCLPLGAGVVKCCAPSTGVDKFYVGNAEPHARTAMHMSTRTSIHSHTRTLFSHLGVVRHRSVGVVVEEEAEDVDPLAPPRIQLLSDWLQPRHARGCSMSASPTGPCQWPFYVGIADGSVWRMCEDAAVL